MSNPTPRIALPGALRPFPLALALLAGIAPQTLAQSQTEDIKLVPADNDEDDLFGHAVSIDGDLALIGAYSDDSNDMDCGAAYVYRFDGNCWVEEAELLASDGSMGDHLGWSAAVSGDLALVGAFNEADAWAGAIYVYRYDAVSQTWPEETKLVGPVVMGGDGFASSVAADGDVVLVGAPGDDTGGDDVGAAYVFRYDEATSTWSTGVKLTASDGDPYDRFGGSVSLSGNVAIVGADRDDYWTGSAYVFRYNPGTQVWFQEAKLTAGDGSTYDQFGIAVSVSGDLALVGALEDDDLGYSSGSAYIYQYDILTKSWDYKEKLRASDGAAYAYFGCSVSISDDRALVGAYEDAENGYKAGAAYVFHYRSAFDDWAQEAKLIASDGDSNDRLGSAVSISDGRALLGAPNDEHSGSYSGSAYLTDMEGGDVGTLNEDTKILASDGDPGDLFGCAVSLSGSLAVLGAYEDDPGGYWSGSAYVGRYDRASETWIEEAKLIASDADEDDHFGKSVSISNNVAVVGAYADEDNGGSGSAYVFRRNGFTQVWTEEAKLLPSDGAQWDTFGYAVAVSGDATLVGAYDDDDAGSSSGSAYVFRYDPVAQSWSEEQKLVAADAQGGDYFGLAVSISGDVALIGAYKDYDLGSYSGSAYVFRYDPVTQQWSQEAKLLPSDGANDDQFGQSVSICGDVAVVGSRWDDDLGTDSGSVYVFHYDSQSQAWSQEAKLEAFDGAADDYFGARVSVTAERILVGSPGHDAVGNFAGAAYLFHRPCSGWVPEAKLAASDGAGGDGMGYAVAVFDGLALVGAGYDDAWRGSAYAFDLTGGTEPTCQWYCGTGANAPTDGYVITNPAALGGVFSATVTGCAPGNTGAILVGYASSLTLSSPWGELLVNTADPAGELVGMPSGFGNPTLIDVPVLTDPVFAGLVFYTQALSFGGSMCLHCAHECTVGT